MTKYCPVCGLPTKNRPLTNNYLSELRQLKESWDGYSSYVIDNISINSNWKTPIQEYNKRTNWLNQTIQKNGQSVHKYCNDLLINNNKPFGIYYSSNDEFKDYRVGDFLWDKLWEIPSKIELLYNPISFSKSRNRILNII